LRCILSIVTGHEQPCWWMEVVMADDRPGEQRGGGEPRYPGGAGVGGRAAGRPGSWFPLLLAGGLAALSLPLSVLASPRLPTGYAVLTAVIYPTVTQAMYLGGGSSTGPSPFPLGWYWVGALTACWLLTAAWYRWRDRRTGGQTRLRGYLVTGLALAAVTAALPLLAWGIQIDDGSAMQAWAWLDAFWRLGTFALLAIAVSLGMLARIGRSRALAVITAIYTAAVCLTGWLDLQQALTGSAYPFGFGDPAVLPPAAVLLLAGLGTTLAASLHKLRSRSAAP
jgi:hypothetical protein